MPLSAMVVLELSVYLMRRENLAALELSRTRMCKGLASLQPSIRLHCATLRLQPAVRNVICNVGCVRARVRACVRVCERPKRLCAWLIDVRKTDTLIHQ